jgi:hypothetical protein
MPARWLESLWSRLRGGSRYGSAHLKCAGLSLGEMGKLIPSSITHGY